jgi:DcmR-like sensory protein
MSPKSIAILTEPHPCGHIVYPYTDEKHIVDAVALFAGSGLEKDEAVVIIATEPHCDLIKKRLNSEGFDIKRLQQTNQFICAVAQDVLARFMREGMPEPQLFHSTVGELIQKAKRSGPNGARRRLRFFGEMVSLLWRVDVLAAARLEELWNEVIATHSVALLCTYALDIGRHRYLPDSLMDAHSHCLQFNSHG